MIKGLYITSLERGYISPQALQANVRGAYIKETWYGAQSATSYNFSNLESCCNLAVNAGKKLMIGFTCGQNSSSVLGFLEKLKFTEYRDGTTNQFTIWLYNPCETIFKTKFIAFLDAFYNWAKTKPFWQYVDGLKITAINRDTQEVRLPTQSNSFCDCEQVWGTKYSQQKITELMTDVIDKTTSFGKDTSMAIVTNPAFPFQNHVKPDPLLMTFRDYAVSKGAYIQANALTDTGGTPAIVTTMPKYGFQINWRRFYQTMDGVLLEKVLRNGINKGASFIEISDHNAVNHKAMVEQIDSEM